MPVHHCPIARKYQGLDNRKKRSAWKPTSSRSRGGSFARQISHVPLSDGITFWSELRPVESIRLIPRSGPAKQRMPNSLFHLYLDWTWRELSKKSDPTSQLSNAVMKYLGW